MPTLGLVFPRFRYPSGDFPLGIALLASVVRDRLGWDVAVCDTTFDPRIEAFDAFLDRHRPDVVGVGMSTLMLGEGLVACRAAKARGIPVFVGGPHPTTDPEGMLAHADIDAAVNGEGEEVTLELLEMFASGVRRPVRGAWVRLADGSVAESHERRPVADLDTLPWPAWDLLDMEAYVAAWGQLDSVRPGLRGVNVNAARGCPFSCSFCQPVLDKMFGKKLRLRSPASVVAEIRALHARYAIEGFWFTDDTFTTRRTWVEAFCAALRESGLSLVWGCTTRANLIPEDLMRTMVAAGLRKIGIGLESATTHVREGIYQKGVGADDVASTVRLARDLGVQTLLFLMLGAPGESRADMLETIRYAALLPATEASFSLFVPIPGTHLHRRMVDQGYRMSSDYTDYDYYARQPFEHELDRAALRNLQRLGYAAFYAHPYRWRSLAAIARSPAGLRSLSRKLLRILPHGTSRGADELKASAAAAVASSAR